MGFEPRTSAVGSDRFANWATTTAHAHRASSHVVDRAAIQHVWEVTIEQKIDDRKLLL